jgi:2-C-methyl-D-erythritol 4-phosphate cytidylyltransferase
MNKESIIAIVPAAGVGARARGPSDTDVPKQYRRLRGTCMLRLAVSALLADPRVTEVRVAVSANDKWADDALTGLLRTRIMRCGGPTRAATVGGALAAAVINPHAWVLVHDAARPGLPPDALARLIEACWLRDRAGLLAWPVGDTVKRGSLGVVEATVPREGLWLAQTPQMARVGVLRAALDRAAAKGLAVTDEACALEHAGLAPLLVRGSVRNFKVTWPEDFELMEKWL